MFITQKHLSRRTVLKGMGVTLALPFLDAMVPAGTAWAKSADAKAMTRSRLVAIEMVHGAAGSAELGLKQNLWSPAAAGSAFDLTPTSLASLEPYRDYLTIVSNTMSHAAEAWSASEVGGDHFRASATFLTQTHPKQTEGSDISVGPSIDQIYAQAHGQDTAIPSLQLCIEAVDQAGGCDYGYACVYTDTISWASATEPLPSIRDPRAAFNQLFGGGGTPEQRRARQRANVSMLDWLTNQIAQIQRELTPGDRQRLDSYLTDVREIERRIQQIEAHNTSGETRALPEAPVGVPDAYDEHVHLMMDLMAAAFSADLTRVFSLKMSRDGSGRVFPGSGVDAGFHQSSHHQEKDDNLKLYHKINAYHVGLLPYFLDKLKGISEGDGNLLEKSLIVYGSPMGDSNLHNHRRLPVFMLGHAAGRIRGNQHVKSPDGTPLANAWLTVLQKLGVDKETFGDSTAAMDLDGVRPVTTTSSGEGA